MMSWSSAPARLLSGAVSTLLVIGVLGVFAPGAAQADSAPLAPTPATPTTVAADALPTVQINGVAWAQVVVGNTVYVAGQFTGARPAGAAPGTQEIVRNNLLAYDIRTGDLITSFAPSLNGQAWRSPRPRTARGSTSVATSRRSTARPATGSPR